MALAVVSSLKASVSMVSNSRGKSIESGPAQIQQIPANLHVSSSGRIDRRGKHEARVVGAKLPAAVSPHLRR